MNYNPLRIAKMLAQYHDSHDSLRQFAKKHGIRKSTLKRRLTLQLTKLPKRIGHNKPFDPELEKELAEFVRNQRTNQGIAVWRPDVRDCKSQRQTKLQIQGYGWICDKLHAKKQIPASCRNKSWKKS